MRRASVFSLLAGATLLCAGAARADLPGPFNWTVPAHVNLVGTSGGVADPAGQFLVVIRDLANNPVPNSHVLLDLSGVSDMHVCATQGDPGMTVNCTQRTVAKFTDAQGMATFSVAGGGHGVPASLIGSARIYADGVQGTNALVLAAFDLDGAGGVSGNDFSLWLEAFAFQPGSQRGDFDGNGVLGGNDLSLLLSAFGSGAQAESCASVCP